MGHARNRSAAAKPNRGSRPVNRWVPFGERLHLQPDPAAQGRITTDAQRYGERQKLCNCASSEECFLSAAGLQSTGGRRRLLVKITGSPGRPDEPVSGELLPPLYIGQEKR
jgi:hypothetical protein